jgi:hypothetical protein
MARISDNPPESTTDDTQARIDAAAESGKERAAEQVDNLASAADAVAASLRDHHQEGLAEYARRMSRELSTMASHLQNRSVDDLMRDARELARNNPSMFLFGSIAVGFGLARFLKASERDDDRDDHDGRDVGSDTETIHTRYPDE